MASTVRIFRGVIDLTPDEAHLAKRCSQGASGMLPSCSKLQPWRAPLGDPLSAAMRRPDVASLMEDELTSKTLKMTTVPISMAQRSLWSRPLAWREALQRAPACWIDITSPGFPVRRYIGNRGFQLCHGQPAFFPSTRVIICADTTRAISSTGCCSPPLVH